MLRRGLLLKLFFVTGATALGFQFVWARVLANSLGHEMRAVLAVVSAFMGGMALGAWCLGAIIRRSAHPGRWYAGLEIFVGLWAILLTPSTPLLLIPATMAMGASFPAMERFIRPQTPQGRSVASLYAANTLGAVAGLIAATWWPMPAMGRRIAARDVRPDHRVARGIAWRLS